MKNEQNSQKNQDQDLEGTNNKTNQQQGNTKQPQTTGANYADASQKSNISVDNDGKIGKAHDQWDNNNKNNDQQSGKRNTGFQPNPQQGDSKKDTNVDTPPMQGNKDKS